MSEFLRSTAFSPMRLGISVINRRDIEIAPTYPELKNLLQKRSEKLAFVCFRATVPYLYSILVSPKYVRRDPSPAGGRDGGVTTINNVSNESLENIMAFLGQRELTNASEASVRFRNAVGSPGMVGALFGDDQISSVLKIADEKECDEVDVSALAVALESVRAAVEPVLTSSTVASRVASFQGDPSTLRDADELVYFLHTQAPDAHVYLRRIVLLLRARDDLSVHSSSKEKNLKAIRQASATVVKESKALHRLLTHVVAFDKAIGGKNFKMRPAPDGGGLPVNVGLSYGGLATLATLKSRFEAQFTGLECIVANAMVSGDFDAPALHELSTAMHVLCGDAIDKTPVHRFLSETQSSLRRYETSDTIVDHDYPKAFSNALLGCVREEMSLVGDSLKRSQDAFNDALTVLFRENHDTVHSNKTIELSQLDVFLKTVVASARSRDFHPILIRDAAILNFALEPRAVSANAANKAGVKRMAPAPGSKIAAMREQLKAQVKPSREVKSAAQKRAEADAGDLSDAERVRHKLNATKLDGFFSSRRPREAPTTTDAGANADPPEPKEAIIGPAEKTKTDESDEELSSSKSKLAALVQKKRASLALLTTKKRTVLEVVHDFQATDDAHLSVTKGETLKLLKKFGDGWIRARSKETGNEGFVPFSYVKEIDVAEETNNGGGGGSVDEAAAGGQVVKCKNWRIPEDCVMTLPRKAGESRPAFVWDNVDFRYALPKESRVTIRRLFSRGAKVESMSVHDRLGAGARKVFSTNDFLGVAPIGRGTTTRTFQPVSRRPDGTVSGESLSSKVTNPEFEKHLYVPEANPQADQVDSARPPAATLSYTSLLELKRSSKLGKLRRDALETYLSEEEFKSVFRVDKKAFEALPKWKRDKSKRDAGLY